MCGRQLWNSAAAVDHLCSSALLTGVILVVVVVSTVGCDVLASSVFKSYTSVSADSGGSSSSSTVRLQCQGPMSAESLFLSQQIESARLLAVFNDAWRPVALFLLLLLLSSQPLSSVYCRLWSSGGWPCRLHCLS